MDMAHLFILQVGYNCLQAKLLELVWGYEYCGDTRTVDVHIQRLRKKLALEETIKTVFKFGYRLELPR
ncbi:winged helix-turn-helix transcriptional regulator [Paenibacillus sp. S150]|nr:winged helix-turn-helix transcriptional regulator [Paenibacillus sp. S150]